MEQTFARELLDFLDASPSCYHAAANVAAALEQAGYWHLMEFEPWHLERGGAYYVMRGDSAVAAFRIPQGPVRGFLLAAGHSDSPTLKLRQEAETASPGNCLRLSVEPYGGGIWRSWLDRPLSVAGRVMVRDGDAIRSRLVNIDRDLLVIPSVAIHMDREVNKKGGLDPAGTSPPLCRRRRTRPVPGDGGRLCRCFRGGSSLHGAFPVSPDSRHAAGTGRRSHRRPPAGRPAVCLCLSAGLFGRGAGREHPGAVRLQQ